MWDFAKPGAKFFHQPGLADAGLADDLDELPFAREGALPASCENDEVLVAADKGRQNRGAFFVASATHAQNTIERHGLWHAFEVMRALVLGDEEPGDLPLDRRSDQHAARLCHGLDTGGDIGRLAENLW